MIREMGVFVAFASQSKSAHSTKIYCQDVPNALGAKYLFNFGI